MKASGEQNLPLRSWHVTSVIGSGIALLLGLLTLVGWIGDVPVLTRFNASYIPMAPSTALLAVLLAAILLLSAGKRVRLPKVMFVAVAGAVTAVSAALLVLSLLGVRLPIEHSGLEADWMVGGVPAGHMSPLTAVGLLLAGAAMLLLTLSPKARDRRAPLTLVAVSAVAALGFLLVLAYLLGRPLLYGSSFIPPALNTSLVIVSLAVALSGRFLANYLPGQERKEKQDRVFRGRLISVIVPAAILIVAGAMVSFRIYRTDFQVRNVGDMMAIADLKTAELVYWRRERIADAEVLAQNPAFADLIEQFVSNPSDGEMRIRLESWMEKVRDSYDYARVAITDRDGREIAAYPTSPVPSRLREQARSAAAGGSVSFSDLHYDPGVGAIRLNVLAPVLTRVTGAEPVGVVALQVDPYGYLYPMVQRWPTESTTAETLLVRRDGDDVLFLNHLRFADDAALNLRIPANDTRLPAAMALNGTEGFVEGVDYRDVPVVAVVGPVPESPWFLVARMDSSEFYRPLSALFYGVLGLVAALLAATAGIGLALWQRQAKAHYRELYDAETARRGSENRFRTTLNSIGDAVIATDSSGEVEFLNPVAEQLTGWNAQDAVGKQLDEVFEIVNEETRRAVENPVHRVIREGGVVGLANHTLLLSRDGSETPIADSGAPIVDDAGQLLGVVLVFRDQTGERESIAKVVASQRQWRRLFDNMSSGFALHEIVTDEDGKPVDYRFLDVNPSFSRLTGLEVDEIGKTARELMPGIADEPAGWIERYGRVALTGEPESFVAHSPSLGKWFSVVAYSPDPGKFAALFDDVTEHRRVERELELRSELLANVGEAVIVSDGDGRVFYWNSAAEFLFGWTEEEATGKPITDLTPSPFRRAAATGRTEDSPEAGPFTGEFQAQTKTGDEITVLLTDTPLYDGSGSLDAVISIARDISSRKALEIRYSGLFRSTRDAILIANTSREIVDCNPAFSDLFGYTLDDIYGRQTSCIYESEEEYEEMGKRLRANIENPDFTQVINYRTISGGTFRGETSTSFLHGIDGSVVGYVGVIRDVSEKELMERQLIQSQKLEALGQIAGGIAHDFNNVLATVSGSSQALRARVTDEAAGRYVDAILSSVKRGIAVTSRMLTFTRPSEPEATSVSLGSFLAEFKDLAKHGLPQQVRINVVGVTDDQRILVDPVQMQQVLFTFAVNSADAMENSGAIRITVRPPTEKEVRIHPPDRPGANSFWCIEFSDEGSGMDEEIQSRIFDPFFTTKDSTKGTGLGLAVAYKIIESHHGWISVSSTPGEGTTMTVGLPSAGEVVEKRGEADTFIPGNSEVILLVDDEEPILTMLDEVLSANGYETLTAPTGHIALDTLKERHDDIALVITDIGLPDINGKTLITMIQGQYPHLPVIAMTGYVDPNLTESLMASGANAVLKKPYDINLLSREIAKQLKRGGRG